MKALKGWTSSPLRVKHVVDLLKFPWPWGDASVEEVHSSHFFEHVPGKSSEVHGGVPLSPCARRERLRSFARTTARAIQDFTHEWPPVAAETFLYFNKGWREQNKLTHGYYDLKCDFDFSYGYAAPGRGLSGRTRLASSGSSTTSIPRTIST